ncbi:unnamed protein product [Prorocentrum cordatum]|uniref:Uncharacterized protein n=1 Tax=Prorocentrum cordatum TaxID=2364126 RepID=A0ABN9TK23_9DINO|nr:unnamed protein product [Polarella glacialis]
MRPPRRRLPAWAAAVALGCARQCAAGAAPATAVRAELAVPPRLAMEFQIRGHVATRGLLAPGEFAAAAGPLWDIAEEERLAAESRKAEAMRSTGERVSVPSALPFVQVHNPSQRHSAARRLALSPALLGAAAALLGVAGVRLYQDSLFWKRPGNGITAWHADLWTVPLDTNKFMEEADAAIRPGPEAPRSSTSRAPTAPTSAAASRLLWRTPAKQERATHPWRRATPPGTTAGPCTARRRWRPEGAPDWRTRPPTTPTRRPCWDARWRSSRRAAEGTPGWRWTLHRHRQDGGDAGSSRKGAVFLYSFQLARCRAYQKQHFLCESCQTRAPPSMRRAAAKHSTIYVRTCA